MKIYNATREVPIEAQKTIGFGGMKGKTDINPMWRIRALTEQFGPCGFGWYTEILEERLEPLPDGRIAAFVKINLFVIVDDKASMPIAGTGGNMYVKKTKNGLEVNDECFKMAYTDAISVACKCLGFGANIYWSSDKTKYDVPDDEPKQEKKAPTKKPPVKKPYEKLKKILDKELGEMADSGIVVLTLKQVQRMYTIAGKKNITNEQVKEVIKKDYNKDSASDLTEKEYDELVKRLEAK